MPPLSRPEFIKRRAWNNLLVSAPGTEEDGRAGDGIPEVVSFFTTRRPCSSRNHLEVVVDERCGL